MSEYPQSYIFTEPSQNYWLVEIDNQGNSMVPVGIPAIVKNYAKDIAATHKTCYNKNFIAEPENKNYILIDKTGTYLAHSSVKYNSTFKELFDNKKEIVGSIEFSDYKTHIISNVCSSITLLQRGVCDKILGMIVKYIFNDKNSIPFSLSYELNNYLYTYYCSRDIGFEYIYVTEALEKFYMYYPTKNFNVKLLKSYTPNIYNLKFDKLVLISHGLIDNVSASKEENRYCFFNSLNFLVEKNCLLVPKTAHFFEGDRLCKDLIKVKDSIKPQNNMITMFDMIFQGDTSPDNKFTQFSHKDNVGLYACNKGGKTIKIFGNDYMVRIGSMSFPQAMYILTNLCLVNNINPNNIDLTIFCCRQYFSEKLLNISPRKQYASPISSAVLDSNQDIEMQNVVSSHDIIMSHGGSNVDKEEMKKYIDSVNIEELKLWLLEGQYSCPIEAKPKKTKTKTKTKTKKTKTKKTTTKTKKTKTKKTKTKTKKTKTKTKTKTF